MSKRALAFLTAAVMCLSAVSCGDDNSKKSKTKSHSDISAADIPIPNLSIDFPTNEPETEPATEHISPLENVTSQLGAQVSVNTVIQREDGSNTIKLPLSDFIEEGDTVSSFTFVIYAEGGTIGTFKGGCGISVSDDCPAATSKGWYQSPDFSAPTEGAYGEITWNVPAEIQNSIKPDGEVLFGYWWGDCTSIRIDCAVCTYTRTRQLPVDGSRDKNIGKSVNYSDADNRIRIPASEILQSGDVPQSVTFNISCGGGFKKFTGAFGAESDTDSFTSQDIAVFTGESSLSLTWLVPDGAKKILAEGGDIMLGYWWGQQQTMTLDSISVKCSNSGGGSAFSGSSSADTTPDTASESSGFRSSAEIMSSIKVGWNLGNTLECYNYSDYADDAETAWGNVRTSPEIIAAVKNAGFNAIRIPVTWGEHVDSQNNIDKAWMDRVQEVVDYAYDLDMFVILNMHHDDYVWFKPQESDYAAESAKLEKIWTQICERFGSYGDRLLFEGMNEPRTVGSSAEWTGGTHEERLVVNKYLQDFVDTVRASGGNNADRTLIVTTYAASAEDAAINDIVIPNSKNLAVSIHYYAPWRFSDGQTTTFTDSDKAELTSKFTQLKQKFSDNGTPVFIAEFGCVAAAPNSERAKYYRSYIEAANSCGIRCFVWDNAQTDGDSSYGLFDRSSLSWNSEILSGIMDGA